MSSPYEELIADFVLEARERVRHIEELLIGAESRGQDRSSVLDEAKRELHTLKGNAGMMGLEGIRGLAHALEEELGSSLTSTDFTALLLELDRFRVALEDVVATRTGSAPRADEARAGDGKSARLHNSVRVPLKTLDGLIDGVVDLLLYRNRLADALSREAKVWSAALGAATAPRDTQLAFEQLDRHLDSLQQSILRLSLVPLQTLFGSLQRVVHDESKKCGKEVRLEVQGGQSLVDKALLELANEALGHLVRNAVVHGIEAPDARSAAGKPRTGTIRLMASTRFETVRIQVSDDGAGVDLEAVRRIVAQHHLDLSAFHNLLDILCLPEFSTRKEADVSAGRGIGLSVVRETVRNRGGRMTMKTQQRKGTSFQLDLPLHISIIRALILHADGEDYAMPLMSVSEMRRLQAGDCHAVNHARVLRWRGGVIPALDVGCTFGTAKLPRDVGYAVVFEARHRKRALLVDGIRGIQEIVVKGLDQLVGRPAGISGSTVLGDGRAILILDPLGLAETKPFVAAGA